MSDDDLVVEATGETVGEAKWAALRELEQRQPLLDKAAVRFEIVSEGERGLLGVGYEPARVVALLPAGAVLAEAPSQGPSAPREGESEQAADVRRLLERIAATIGVDCRVDTRDVEGGVEAVFSGAGDLGLLIGRHGQTIDAIQYLVNTIAWRTYGDERKEVIVDAAGYRERRRELLEGLAVETAERALQRGEPIELEPMTAAERKVVHLRLAEYEGVETSSQGVEPHRYVVVAPAE